MQQGTTEQRSSAHGTRRRVIVEIKKGSILEVEDVKKKRPPKSPKPSPSQL
jgi:hypothetical protein